jgi:hypothetical protein
MAMRSIMQLPRSEVGGVGGGEDALAGLAW